MTITQALGELSSVEFAIHMNVVSGTKRLLSNLQSTEAFTTLRDALVTRRVVAQEQVLSKASDLVADEVDSRYAHPHDTALTVLLLAFYFEAPRRLADLKQILEKVPAQQTHHVRQLLKLIEVGEVPVVPYSRPEVTAAPLQAGSGPGPSPPAY